MQNKCYPADEAGFVTLGSGWLCGGCGCQNHNDGCCARCGWNRCGVVRTTQTAQHAACGCESPCAANAAANARTGCRSCPPAGPERQIVEGCPDNTSLRDAAREAADCGCAAAAARNRCGCGAARQTETCGCTANTAGAAYTSGNTNAGVGMVYAVEQSLGQVYQSESALRAGTLFPELHKPLNGYCPGSCNCATTGQQSAFAAWELRLYLDTHPDDQRAQALFARLCREVEDPSYATAFLTGTSCGTRWDWTDDPWPWECGPCGM